MIELIDIYDEKLFMKILRKQKFFIDILTIFY